MTTPVLVIERNFQARYGYWTGPGWSAGQSSPSFIPFTQAQRDVEAFDAFDRISKVHDIAYDGVQQRLIQDLGSGITAVAAVGDYLRGVIGADQRFLDSLAFNPADTATGEAFRHIAAAAIRMKMEEFQVFLRRITDSNDELASRISAYAGPSTVWVGLRAALQPLRDFPTEASESELWLLQRPRRRQFLEIRY